MSETGPVQRPITLAEINAQIEEIECQRDAALKRCSVLAGEKHIREQLLIEARAEIERLASENARLLNDVETLSAAASEAAAAAATAADGAAA